jgi:hypothetical protein
MATEHTRRPKPARTEPRRNISGALGGQNDRFIEDSVRNAYSVVEPWMQEGQRIARQLSNSSFGRLNLPEGTRELQGRWLQATGELMATMFDIIGAATESVSENESRAQDPPPRARHSSIEYQISSHLPIRVHAHLAAGASNYRLKARGFKKREGLRVRIRTRSNGVVVVRIGVRADLAPGKHSSDIVNADDGEIVFGRIRIILG